MSDLIVATSKRRSDVMLLNQTHKPIKSFFLDQKDVIASYPMLPKMGLCAGLIQVWWSFLHKNDEPMPQLKLASDEVLRSILLSQLRSLYLQEERHVSSAVSEQDRQLLFFKYRVDISNGLPLLKKCFNARGFLELDLMLQHHLPLHSSFSFAAFDSTFYSVVLQNTAPGLYIILTRFGSKRAGPSHARGHRVAYAVGVDGSCRLYDPNCGEFHFADVCYLCEWLPGYAALMRWNNRALRPLQDVSAVRLFYLGGELNAKTSKASRAIHDAIWFDKQSTSSESVRTMSKVENEYLEIVTE